MQRRRPRGVGITAWSTRTERLGAMNIVGRRQLFRSKPPGLGSACHDAWRGWTGPGPPLSGCRRSLTACHRNFLRCCGHPSKAQWSVVLRPRPPAAAAAAAAAAAGPRARGRRCPSPRIPAGRPAGRRAPWLAPVAPGARFTPAPRRRRRKGIVWFGRSGAGLCGSTELRICIQRNVSAWGSIPTVVAV